MVTESRDEKINNNLGLVHSVAKKFRGRGVDYDDLFQNGCLGLIKAVDNFDETRGFAFSTYAVPVIMGEIKRIFRDGGAVKVSRCLKEKAIKVQALRENFLKRELREPTISELSELLDCTEEEMADILNVIQPTISLNSYGEDGDEVMEIPVDESEQLFDRISVAQMLEHLSEKEKYIVELRFFQGKTQTEVARLLGISQVQVSRKEKSILLKLRKLME